MAQYEFWARLDKPNDVIDIPDEVLTGLEGKELENKILEYHIKWANRQVYGGWYDLKQPIDTTEQHSSKATEAVQIHFREE